MKKNIITGLLCSVLFLLIGYAIGFFNGEKVYEWVVRPFNNTEGQFDLSIFWSAFAGVATFLLGFVALFQTKKANDLSNKLAEKEFLESYCFVRLQSKIELKIKHNADSRITWSAPHKIDSDAQVLFEPYDPQSTEKLNEYYIQLFFKDCSKSTIKSIRLENPILVQEPSPIGLQWRNGSDDPIPQRLNIMDGNEDMQINWISQDEFFVHIKIYSPPSGVISTMIESGAPCCFMFILQVKNIVNILTGIWYKAWIEKDVSGSFVITRTNTTKIEEEIPND